MKFHWGKGILVYFIIFLSLCAVFIIFSLRQHNDLVTDDYYEKGANYSEQIEINHRSETFKDSIDIEHRNSFVVLHLSSSIVALTDSISVYFYRPSDKRMDITAIESTDSLLNFDARLFSHGRYKVKIGWEINDQKFEVQKTLDID